jgi:hypothetical protein
VPVVHQSGPHRLWDTLDRLRHAWLRDGSLPAYGAKVTITPDGGITLKRGRWQGSSRPADLLHRWSAGRYRARKYSGMPCPDSIQCSKNELIQPEARGRRPDDR